ncbi:hypothetical protein EPZ47_08260 [Pseudomonas viciae]|uniref:Uncharacterized protein n=1 Tax=Pseudomonas viciae TaxID=2505979 RepID=A0A4P7PF17_9PSED|nr:hypothetical protein EPZ47_08260 [Pseudomonas viciae]
MRLACGFSVTANPCGSGLARESGGPACINAVCAGAFASKPAPTVGLRYTRKSHVVSWISSPTAAPPNCPPTAPECRFPSACRVRSGD